MDENIKAIVDFYNSQIKEASEKVYVYNTYLKNKNMVTIYEEIRKEILKENEKISFYKDTIKLYEDTFLSLP